MDLTIHSNLAAPADAKIVLADQTLPSGEFATVFNAPGPVLTQAATPRFLGRDTAQPFADRSSGDIAPSLTDGDDVDAPAPEISQPVERGRTPSDRELQVLPTPTEQQKPVGSAAIAEFAQTGASRVSHSPQRDRLQPASTDVLPTRSSSEVTIAIAVQTAAAIVPLTPSIEAKQSVLKPQAQPEPLDALGKTVLPSVGNVSNTSERHFQPNLTNAPALDPASIGKTAGMETSDIRIQTANVSTAPKVADIQQAPPQPQPGDRPSPETLGTKPATHSALTSLERHLGGHPATLVPDLTRQRRAPPPELGSMRFAVDGPRSDGANLITSHIITAQPRNHAPMTIAGTVPTAMMATAAPTTPLNADVTNPNTDLTDHLVSDIRAHTSNVHTVSPASIAPRQDMAHSVIQQIATAMRDGRDKAVEIALNPAELGRVRMVLSASDAGITVNILADRPDTLDLLRRNIEDLGKSFTDLGYDDIAFSFGQNDQMSDEKSQTQHDTGIGSDDQDFDHPTPVSAIPTAPSPIMALDGIDLRL